MTVYKHLPDTIVITVPRDAIDDSGYVTLELRLPTSSENTSKGTTKRQLGLGLISATLLDPTLSNPLQSLPHSQNWADVGQPLHVDLSRPAHRDICAPGESFSDAWGAGHPTGEYDVIIPMLPTHSPMQARLKLRPIATPQSPVVADILWSGQKLTQARWEDDAPVTLDLDLPGDLAARSGPAILSIRSYSLMTPKDLDLGPTVDLAGVGLYEISLTPKVG